MASYNNETNLEEDEYDDLDDFIVGSDNEAEEDEQELPEAEDDEQELPEAEEEEEEEVEEEEEEPPVGVQEILSIREQLKAKYRKQHQSNGAGTPSCSTSEQAPARSRFGTFFGPSTPALAPRLIEAGSSSIMKEIQNVPSRRDAAPSTSKSQPSSSTHEQKPKVVTQVKRKVDTLRENRDYSNLFSDDPDTSPPPANEQPETRPVVSPKSDVEVRRKATLPAGKNKVHTTSQPASEKDNKGSIQSKLSSQVKKPSPNGRNTNPSVSNGSRPSNVIKKPPGVQPSSNGQNPQRPMQSKRPQKPSQIQRPPQVQRQQNHAQSSSQVQRVKSSVQSQQQPAQKGSALSQDRRKSMQKQPAPSSKPKPSATSAVYNDRAKTKVGVKRKLSEAEKVRQMVRDVFNYNPDKYAGRDEDDSNMEVGFASIEMEERRSAKLARKEDQEQLLMIQEEERRERANKKKQPAQS
uniref:Uncharacterized protein n=1 Tax=Avena sativa TaxID=4498 RepID=A0ACD5YLQ4_AVESA